MTLSKRRKQISFSYFSIRQKEEKKKRRKAKKEKSLTIMSTA